MQHIKATTIETVTTTGTGILRGAQYPATPVLLQVNVQIKTTGVVVHIKSRLPVPFFSFQTRFLPVRDYRI